MAYDLDLIRTALKTLLATITEIAFVYDRRNPNIEGFPAVIFDITNNENIMLTNTQNQRTITYTLYIIAEIGTAGATQANTILDIATKKVVEILEDKDNITLSGNADWIMPVVGAREEVSSPNGSQIWQQLDLQVRVVSSIL